jgi:membrane-associated protein
LGSLFEFAFPRIGPYSNLLEERTFLLESILHFLRSLYDPEGLKELIRWGGPVLVCTIIFVETGLFVGFFLPGDSLLLAAGIFSGQNVIPLRWLLFPGILCAIAGDQLGYWIGRGAGPALYSREDSFFFRRNHLQRAREFYEKYGGRAIILSRFIPIVRTFCPPVAGAARMSYPRYLFYDIFGGTLWVGGMVLGGYVAAVYIPNIGKYIHLIIGGIIILSILPPIISILKARYGVQRPVDPAVNLPIPDSEVK